MTNQNDETQNDDDADIQETISNSIQEVSGSITVYASVGPDKIKMTEFTPPKQAWLCYIHDGLYYHTAFFDPTNDVSYCNDIVAEYCLKSELDAALAQNALLMKALNEAAWPETAAQFLRDYQKEKSNDK